MPEDKTNLTNASVQGSDESKSSRQGPGNDRLNDLDESGIPWKNRAEEYRSKYEAVAEKLEATDKRLSELDEKFRLTESEKAEKARLENRGDRLEDELREIETNPQYRAFNEKIRRHSETTKKEAVSQAKSEFYKEAVDSFLDDESESLGIKSDDLRKELNDLVRTKHMELNPLKRIKVVLKEFKANRDRIARDAEQTKKEQESSRFTEGNGRAPREMTLEEAKKSGSFHDKIRALGKDRS